MDTSLSGVRIAVEPDRAAELSGHPCIVASDNGTKLNSNATLKRQDDCEAEWHDIAPRETTQNGPI